MKQSSWRLFAGPLLTSVLCNFSISSFSLGGSVPWVLLQQRSRSWRDLAEILNPHIWIGNRLFHRLPSTGVTTVVGRWRCNDCNVNSWFLPGDSKIYSQGWSTGSTPLRIVRTYNMPALCSEMVTICWLRMALKIATLMFSNSFSPTSYIQWWMFQMKSDTKFALFFRMTWNAVSRSVSLWCCAWKGHRALQKCFWFWFL